MPMTRRRQLAIVLMVSGIACVPIGAYASEEETYWYGFYVGAASATCELNKAGQLSREYAKDFLIGAFEQAPDIPASSRKNALKEIRSKYPQCPLPQ